MLVLARKLGEEIRIGDHIVVTVLSYREKRGEHILGISAPRDIPVHRGEIYQKIKKKEKQDEAFKRLHS